MAECRGKVRHVTEEAAQRVVTYTKDVGLRAYLCPQCAGWHVTSQVAYYKTPNRPKGMKRSLWRKVTGGRS